MATATYAGLTNEQRMKYSKEVGVAFREEVGITDYLYTPADFSIPKHKGNTLNYRIFSVTHNDAVVAEGADVNEVDINVGKVDVDIKKYGVVVKITEEAMDYSIDDLRKYSAEEIGKNFKETEEKLAFAAAVTTTNFVYAAGSDTTRPTDINDIDETNFVSYNDVVKVGTKMRTNKVPRLKLSDGSMGYVMFVTPVVGERIMTDETWIKFNQFKGNNSANGAIGKVNNVEVLMSTYVPVVDNTASKKVAQNICLGNKSLGGIKPEGKNGIFPFYTPKEIASPKSLSFAYVGAKMWNATALLRTEGVCKFLSYNG